MGVNAVCRLLGVSKKSYYYSVAPEQRLAQKHRRLREAIETVIHANPGYGYRRIGEALRQEYRLVVNHKLLKRLLRLWGLHLRRAIRKPTRSYLHQLLDFLGRRANLLFRVKAHGCLQVIVSDVTEIVCHAGKAYLAVHLDQFGKLVLGWSLSVHPDVSLVMRSLKAAFERVRVFMPVGRRLIVHQDRGSVYTADLYVRTIRNTGYLLSYSRRGEPGDNAVNESFFSRFKEEWREAFAEARTFEQLQRMVEKAIVYYNERRYHSSIGYRTPLAFITESLSKQTPDMRAVS